MSLRDAGTRRFLRRSGGWLAVDAAIVAVSFCAALGFRLLAVPPERWPDYLGALAVSIVPLVALYLLFNLAFQLDQRAWWYAGAGEVGLIFAAVGAALRLPDGTPVIDARTNAAVVVMVFATTLITPPVLSWSLRRRASS